MKPYLQRILQLFDEQNTLEYSVIRENELKTLLKNLNYKEKPLFAETFKTVSWNIGSLVILNVLQECNILTASEYLLLQGNSEDDFEHIQGVLSDIIESNSALLANVIINCAYNSSNTKLILYLEEAIQRLIKDFQENENVISYDYFTKLSPYLEDEAMIFFTNLHFNFLLELNITTSRKALGQIDNWKCFISSDSKFYKLINEIVKTNLSNITRKILQISLFPNFHHWKYLIIFLHIVTNNANHSTATIIKKHLRKTFKLAITKGSLNLLLSLLILARTVCVEEEHPLFDTYSQWYKNTIGDLKYIVANKSEFINTIELLTAMVNEETDRKYLEVHAKISISPLAHCNEIILQYKRKCREKIETLISEMPELGEVEFAAVTNLNDAEEDLFDSQDHDL